MISGSVSIHLLAGCVRRTIFRRLVQHGGSRNQLLQDFIPLALVSLGIILFLLAEGLQQRGDLGLDGGFVGLGEGVEVGSELLGELGEGALDQEGG